MKEAVQRVKDIFDAKHAPSSPEQIVDNSPNLTDEQKQSQSLMLKKHVSLFDGTLGKRKGIQHKLELKDPSLPPVALMPHPVPVSQKRTLPMELERLHKTGVLRKVNDSEWQA